MQAGYGRGLAELSYGMQYVVSRKQHWESKDTRADGGDGQGSEALSVGQLQTIFDGIKEKFLLMGLHERRWVLRGRRSWGLAMSPGRPCHMHDFFTRQISICGQDRLTHIQRPAFLTYDLVTLLLNDFSSYEKKGQGCHTN